MPHDKPRDKTGAPNPRTTNNGKGTRLCAFGGPDVWGWASGQYYYSSPRQKGDIVSPDLTAGGRRLSKCGP